MENWLLVSNMTWKIWQIFTYPLKSLKMNDILSDGLFLSKVYKAWAKNAEQLPFMTLNSDEKFE